MQRGLATQTKDGKVPPRGLACGPIIPLTLQCLTNVAMGYLLIFKQDDLGDTLSGKDGRTASLFACQRDSFPFRFVSFGHTFTPKDFRWALDSELASAGVASFTCCFRIWLDSSTSFYVHLPTFFLSEESTAYVDVCLCFLLAPKMG
jgi:hypothetical protein